MMAMIMGVAALAAAAGGFFAAVGSGLLVEQPHSDALVLPEAFAFSLIATYFR